MPFELPKLPYSYDALEPHIDAQTMEVHHSKHHAAYTTNLNGALEGTAGEGKSIEEMEKAGKLEEVKKLYEDSLFFRSLLGNSMQSLAKSFYPSTAYLKDNKTYGKFWELMHEEYQRSVMNLLKVSGMSTLLEDNSLSKSSIAIRERIVLPLITIQQYAIQEMLEKGEDDAVLQKLILRTMFGIINAARNAA